MGPGDARVLAFDIFGTVVDWHGSIVREMAHLHPQVDGDAFARAWRAGYKPAMARVMSGELGWTLIDDLHRIILDQILPQFDAQIGAPFGFGVAVHGVVEQLA